MNNEHPTKTEEDIVNLQEKISNTLWFLVSLGLILFYLNKAWLAH